MLHPNIEAFLAQADLATLAVAMRHHEAFHVSNREATLLWLQANRKTMYYQVLGCLYDVAVYPVDGTGVTANAPASDRGMFFASTLAGDFPDAPVIPLQSTMEACYHVACELLGLERLFKAETEAGESLGRYCKPA